MFPFLLEIYLYLYLYLSPYLLSPHIPEGEIRDHMLTLMFNFLSNPQTLFHSGFSISYKILFLIVPGVVGGARLFLKSISAERVKESFQVTIINP